MPAKKSTEMPKAERAVRRASAAAPKKAPVYKPVAAGKRTKKAAREETPTTGETSPFVTTTTSPDVHSSSGKRKSSDKKATPVPIKLIKNLQATLQQQAEAGKAPKDRSYSQDELKNILNNFWEVLKSELIHGEDHKVSLMNYMTFRLVFRDGQKFIPPRNENSLKSPEEVTKPPRWNLSVNIKDKLKTELQHEFAMSHGDIVHAFESGKNVKALATQRGLIKVKKPKQK